MVRAPDREIVVDLAADDPRRLGELARAASLGGFRLVPAPASTSRWTFYDNDLRSLARQGFDLAVHRARGRREAVLSTSLRAAKPGFREANWTAPVSGIVSAPLRLPEGPLRERVLPLAAGRPLAPIVVAHRSVRLFDVCRGRRGGSPLARLEIESWSVRAVGTDTGGVRLHGVRLRIPERHGAALREWIGKWTDRFGLRPVTSRRLPRMLQALHGPGALGEVPGGGVREGDTRGVAARRLFSVQLGRLRKHDPGTRRGEDPEDLHDMRVATRRMRAALRAYRSALPGLLRDALARDLRWLGRRLGAVRDVDVLLERFRADGADPHLLDHLRRRREEAREGMLAALRSRRYLRLVSALDVLSRGWSVEPPPEEAFRPAGPHAAAEARKARDRLVRQGDSALARPGAEELHDTRIRAKRLRYLLEFHRGLAGPEGMGLVRRLKALQDHLGAHQDAVVAMAEVRAFLRRHGEVLGAPTRAASEEYRERLRGEAARLRRRWRGRWIRLREALTGEAAGKALAALEGKKGDAPKGAP